MRGEARRLATHDAGEGAEWWAALALRLKGYRILERRYRAGRGEIDLIATPPFSRRNGVVAFIEVKRRADEALASEALTADKRRRMASAASVYLARHPRFADAAQRYDLMLIVPGRWPVHVIDAWQD
ncbi:MAG: YraN family protein [Alphaproteobacteria bacterium]|nr:YraN family protein [Alphaproteobacteria bacterium]